MDIQKTTFKKTNKDELLVFALCTDTTGDLGYNKIGVIKKGRGTNKYVFYVRFFLRSLGDDSLNSISKKLKEMNRGVTDE